MNMKNLKNKKGFTLIELIVVMAVIAILVLLAAPRFLGYTKDANVSAMKADAKVLENVSLVYNIEEEAWPVGEAATPSAELEAVLPTYDHDNDPLTDEIAVPVYSLDEAAITAQVKSLKNGFEAYGLIIDGDQEGTVVHLAGVENRTGERHFSTDLSDKE